MRLTLLQRGNYVRISQMGDMKDVSLVSLDYK